VTPTADDQDRLLPDELHAALAEARAARDADIERLATLDEEQLYYLAHLDEIPDPVTDGLVCGLRNLDGSPPRSGPRI
jgi:hypothetical protein